MNASTFIELSLNEYQRSLHTYKDRHHECHALGLSGEVAEVLKELSEAVAVAIASGNIADMVKKATAHGVPLDRDALKKELGDVLWYITAIASDNQLSLQEIAEANVAKLRARYPQGFVKGGGVRTEDPKTLSCARPEPVGAPFLREMVRQGIVESSNDAIYRTGDVSLAGGVPTVLQREENVGSINRSTGPIPDVSVNLRTAAQPVHSVSFGCGCRETTIDGATTRRYCPNGECRRLKGR